MTKNKSNRLIVSTIVTSFIVYVMSSAGYRWIKNIVSVIFMEQEDSMSHELEDAKWKSMKSHSGSNEKIRNGKDSVFSLIAVKITFQNVKMLVIYFMSGTIYNLHQTTTLHTRQSTAAFN